MFRPILAVPLTAFLSINDPSIISEDSVISPQQLNGVGVGVGVGVGGVGVGLDYERFLHYIHLQLHHNCHLRKETTKLGIVTLVAFKSNKISTTTFKFIKLLSKRR